MRITICYLVIANSYIQMCSCRKEMNMNKRLILIVGGISIVGNFLIGTIWGWVTALSFLIGLFLFALIVFGRYALLKFYLKTFALRTVLYTNPISAILYSFVDPHSSKQSNDLDDLFPSKKTQEPEELPPFHFKEATEEEQRGNNTGKM